MNIIHTSNTSSSSGSTADSGWSISQITSYCFDCISISGDLSEMLVNCNNILILDILYQIKKQVLQHLPVLVGKRIV